MPRNSGLFTNVRSILKDNQKEPDLLKQKKKTNQKREEIKHGHNGQDSVVKLSNSLSLELQFIL